MTEPNPIPDAALRDALTATAGEPVVLMEDLDWDLKNPCDDCPFMRTSPYHEGVAAGLPGYGDSIMAGTFGHTCHKTDRRPSCDGPQTFEGKPKHCAGAILMLLKTRGGVSLQRPLIEAIQAKKIDINDMADRARANPDVFTLPQMLAFYGKEVGRRLGERKRRKESLASRDRRRRKKLERQRKKK